MIKVISFDIGGTILLNNSSNEDKYNLKNLSLLVNMPYEDVRKVYKDVFQKKKGDFDSLVSAFCEKLSIKVNAQIISFFQKKFELATTSVINEDVLRIFPILKEYGYKIILFSNTNCLLPDGLTEEVLKYVDKIFYSYDLGFTKNEEESYRKIEKKLGLEPNEFLHIGDVISSDYYIPLQNGWNALYYGNSSDESVKTINRLTDIPISLNINDETRRT